MYEMARGKPPFSELPEYEVLYRLGKGSYDASALAKGFSKQAKKFFIYCLERDAEKRPSAAQLAQHDFFRKAP